MSNTLEPEFKPILRQVDVIPGEYEGQPVFFLRDPLGFVEELIVLPQSVLFLLAMMNGDNDLRDLQAEATRRMGQIVPLEEITNLVSFLDEKGLLWSEKFEELKEKAYEKWFQLKIRPMAHANQAYPLDENDANWFLSEVFKLSEVQSANPPRILIAPHIDIRVGARAYAEAYRRFNLPPGSRVIIFGVGHYLEFPLSVLTKDLATPFGILRNDRGGLLFLTNSKKLELFPDHMAHKLEHSIEFQALFLKYGRSDELVALPFLIGSMQAILPNEEYIDKFVEGLLDLFDERTYLVLGIDYCHLGLRYGHQAPVNEDLLNEALKVDRYFTELAFAGSSKELAELLQEKSLYNICGSSSLYLLAKLISKGGFNGRGEIFYQEALPFGQGSAVTVLAGGYFV